MRWAAMGLVAGGLMFAFLFAVGADSGEKTKKQKRQEKAQAAQKAQAEKQAGDCDACQAKPNGYDVKRCFQFVTADYGSYCSYASYTCQEPFGWLSDNWMPPWSTLPGDCGAVYDPNCIGGTYKATDKTTELEKKPGDEPLAKRTTPQFGMPPFKGAKSEVTHVEYVKVKDVLNNEGKKTLRTIKVVRIVHTFRHKGKDITLPVVHAWEVDDQPASFTEINSHTRQNYRINFDHTLTTEPKEAVSVDAMLTEHPYVPEE